MIYNTKNGGRVIQTQITGLSSICDPKRPDTTVRHIQLPNQ